MIERKRPGMLLKVELKRNTLQDVIRPESLHSKVLY
jgi:hypothetical protein